VFELPRYPFARPADLDEVAGPQRYPLVIVGAGLTGLTLALDLVRRGHRVLVLDDDDTVGVRGLASRGIVWAQRTLDIFHRLGVGEKIVSKGVTWNVGRVLCRDAEVTSFRLQQEPDLRFNGFTNLQQYYVEQFLVDALRATGQADLRWLNRVEDVHTRGDAEPVELEVSTPEGQYRMLADWVVGCDGSSSRVRDGLGLAPVVFDRTEDRWIIIDIVAKNADIPEERWTWLDCSANFGRAVWRHRMADGTWRLDFQMSPHEDAEQAASEAGMRERVRRLLGPAVAFDIAWSGVWQYRHESLASYRHGRVLFAGDAAHVVSPFGARGGNGGIQDADALGWRLSLVMSGRAAPSLLDQYSDERHQAAMENIRQTRRSARFVHPADQPSAALWREAIVALANRHPLAARMINTGRLSAPAVYGGRRSGAAAARAGVAGGAGAAGAAGAAGTARVPVNAAVGRALPNVRLRSGDAPRYLHDLLGHGFTALSFDEGGDCPQPEPHAAGEDALRRVNVRACCDDAGWAALERQLPAPPAGIWLIRPDGHVLSTDISPDPVQQHAALEEVLTP
jgi:3-(3-hydroxy-phenyl)propionate hydroxylase